MSTTQVSIRLGVEGKADVKRAFDEVGKAGQDAFRGVATSMDAAGAAADRETQRLQRLAQAAKQAAAADQAQRNFNAVLGISTAPPKSARESAEVFEQTAKAAEDLQRRTDALRAQIDPLGAAQKKLNAEIAEANTLYKAGAITAKEQAAAHALAQQHYQATARSLGSVGGQSRLTAAQLTNLSYQLNDVFVSLASGQPPLMVLIQQGSQIAQVMGPVGVTGALKGVAQACRDRHARALFGRSSGWHSVGNRPRPSCAESVELLVGAGRIMARRWRYPAHRGGGRECGQCIGRRRVDMAIAFLDRQDRRAFRT